MSSQPTVTHHRQIDAGIRGASSRDAAENLVPRSASPNKTEASIWTD